MPKVKGNTRWLCKGCKTPVPAGVALCEGCLLEINDPRFQALLASVDHDRKIAAPGSPQLKALRETACRFFGHPEFTNATIRRIDDWLVAQELNEADGAEPPPANRRLRTRASEIVERLQAAETREQDPHKANVRANNPVVISTGTFPNIHIQPLLALIAENKRKPKGQRRSLKEIAAKYASRRD